MSVIKHFLPLPHISQISVIENADNDRELNNCFFSSSARNCVVHNWFCPTSVVITASSNKRLIASMIFFGVRPSSCMAIEYFSFHCLISAAHSETASGFAFSSSTQIAFFASATIGTSTTIFREMEAASISIWITFACAANSSIFPVMRSLNLVPMENKTSHRLIAEFAA